MNDEPSPDEVFVFIGSLAALFVGLRFFMGGTAGGMILRRKPAHNHLLVLAVFGGLLALFIILKAFAAKDIRNSLFYILLFVFLGIAWVLWSARLFPALGLSIREDAQEQRNAAAAIAASGAMLAVLLTYAGGNIGEGATIWTTIFSSLLATIGLFACWLLLELFSRVSLAVTEERDAASGLRLAGFLVAESLILGRAVAGDWTSTQQTVIDFFHDGWPVLTLVVAAILAERAFQPTLKRPVPSSVAAGVFPALFYIVIAIAALIFLGKWK